MRGGAYTIRVYKAMRQAMDHKRKRRCAKEAAPLWASVDRREKGEHLLLKWQAESGR